jgi:rod shape-determining protein MreC
VGQITEVSSHYSKVLLIIDPNSAVDALVQSDRARGIIKGDAAGELILKYVLRKSDIAVSDTVVSSGLDGVFPKGLAVGQVSGVFKPKAGIFQEVTVTPFVDFEKLEEVLVVLNPKKKIKSLK